VRFHEVNSELWLGDFDAENCFRLEDENHYDKVLKHQSIQTVDFILHRPDKATLFLVEAKRSLYESRKGFDNDIKNYTRQFVDGLTLVCSTWLGGHSGKINLPEGIQHFFKHSGKVVLVLVVKYCKKNELNNFEDAIKKHFRENSPIWGDFEIIALDEDMAKKENLVLELEDAS